MFSGMTESERLISSLIVAIALPWVIALFLNLFVNNWLFLLAVGIALSGYTLVAGFQNNGELEVTVGGLFGKLTSWVIPPGISWWFPKPFGESLRKVNIGKRELDRRVKTGNPLKEVETSDNNQVVVGLYAMYEIFDPTIWVRVENPEAAFDAILERTARWFVNEWPVDEIASQRENFSKYLMGSTVLVHKLDDAGEPIGNERKIRSDIKRVLKKDLGVKLISIRVDNINPPKSYVEAREAEAVEESQGRKEARNVDALVTQIEKIKSAGVTPDHAMHGALVTRKDLQGHYVGGNGGDFTKGAVVTSQTTVKGRK